MDPQLSDPAIDRRRDRLFQTFTQTLESDGLRPALRALSEASAFRFAGVFQFDGETLRCLAHVDRADPDALAPADQPVQASYCCYVRDARGAFTTLDALHDPAAAGHPKRAILRAYCGVPVMDAEGELFGTLCLFDPDAVSDAEPPDLELLVRVAAELGRDGRLLHLLHDAARA